MAQSKSEPYRSNSAHPLPPPRPHPRVARRFQSKILTGDEGRKGNKGTKKKRKEREERKRKNFIQLSSIQTLIKSNDLESKKFKEQD